MSVGVVRWLKRGNSPESLWWVFQMWKTHGFDNVYADCDGYSNQVANAEFRYKYMSVLVDTVL